MIPTFRHHQLTAAALAFPLCDNAALLRASPELTRTAVGVATDPLAAATLEHLRTLLPGASLAQLAHLRDDAWFPAGTLRISLTDRILAVATAHLEHRGHRVGLRQDNATPLPALVERWRWLSLALPADLLLAAFAASCDAPPRADHVELVTAHLSRTLSSPCAETHLHVGAAVPFGVLWTGLMRHLAEVTDPRTLLGSKKLGGERFGAVVPLGDPGRYLHLLFAAAMARLVLASFLRSRERGDTAPLDTFLRTHLTPLAARLVWPWGPLDAERRLRATLGFLGAPKRTAPHGHFVARDLLRAMSGPVPPPTDDPYETLIARDELTCWLTADGDILPETRFCARALGYLRHNGRDGAFATLFWQYQRVRCASFRLLTQPPGTAGLDWFTCFYNRISFFRDALPTHRGQEASWFHALLTQSRDLHLRALEARTRPEDDVSKVRDQLRDVARQTLAFHKRQPAHKGPEVGYVLHFVKEHQGKIPGRGPHLHADPSNPYYRARHGRWFADQSRRADAVAGTLRDHPELLLVLRGIDVANHELAQPTWVLLPLFERVRRASECASHLLSYVLPRWRVAPLRATAHAGEDYLRLVEGLRRMHEAIEFRLLRQGDRFGHGLAVGTDPDDERDGTVMQPREDRLDDLLWELDRLAHGDLDGVASRAEQVRHEALLHAGHIYRDTVTIDTDVLIAARQLRHTPDALTRLRYPVVDCSRARSGRAWEFFVAHLTDHGVFHRGRELVPVASTEGERTMLREAQRWLCCELSRREITIESNPSSNLLIGDLHAVTRHPAMRIQPVGAGVSACHSVPLSMNTDNPITFASCLADEFAFVHAALLQRGVSASDSLAWIDARRNDGWRSRFTLEASTNPDHLRLLLPEHRQRRDVPRSSFNRSAVVSGR